MIIGHKHQWRYLKELMRLEKIPHGLLFFGPENIGKQTVAFELAKLLTCQESVFESKPCQTCKSCKDIEGRRHPDCLFIKPPTKEIQISQIRELKWWFSLKPWAASCKIAVIDQAHLMNQEAQTALLKTLEEPGKGMFLILVTEYPELLFPTIRSRVQKIRFLSPKRTEIEEYLKSQSFSQDEIQELFEISLGRPGKIMHFVSSPKDFSEQKQVVKKLMKVLDSDLVDRFQYVKSISENNNLKEVLAIWLSHLRNILLSQIKREDADSSSLKKLKKILNQIQEVNFLLSTTNVNKRLALEIIMLA